jgi:hypothetical protein
MQASRVDGLIGVALRICGGDLDGYGGFPQLSDVPQYLEAVPGDHVITIGMTVVVPFLGINCGRGGVNDRGGYEIPFWWGPSTVL